jgi:LuxR family maltose regulon positive regulatory protein
MAIGTDSLPLIATKLHRAPIDRLHVHRPLLLERLEQRRSRPLTLVSAPAGYGKSILIRCWLESCNTPGSCLSLDENDNDLRMFAGYFVAAVKKLFPGACRKTEGLLTAPDLPPAAEMGAILINELNGIEQSFILALDDFHFIKNEAVLDMMRFLLSHPPRAMHLVLIGRHDPALPISSLRSKSLVTEIRTRDLRFDLRQTEDYLTQLLGITVDPSTATALMKKTEGWVTGLRLAVLSMRHRTKPEPKLLEPHADAQYVMEYLFSEVFSQHPPVNKKYLISISILERFCAPLCEAVCRPAGDSQSGEISGWTFLAWLKTENMFLIPLDAENRWFRFHHLFQKLLLNQLKRHFSAEDINALHAQASAWLADNGFIDEAIRHALAGADEIGAAQLVEQHRQAMLNTDRWYVLEKWLSMLPNTLIQQRPELLLAQAWIHYFHFRLTLIPSVLDVAESLIRNKSKEKLLYGEIFLFKGVLCFLQGDGSPSLKYIEEALERIPTTYPMIRGFAESYFGFAGQMHGQEERILDVLSGLLHQPSLHDKRKARVMLSIASVHIVSGNLALAATLSQQLNRFAINTESIPNVASSSWFQGVIHFCRNELDMAIDYLSQVAENIYIMPRRISVDCMAGLALAYQATQQTDKVTATMERLLGYIHSSKGATFLEIAHSCRARLSLMKGETPFASSLPGIDTTSGGEAMFIFLEIPSITQCRVFLAGGSDEGLREAEQRLQAYLQLGRKQHNTFQKITIRALLALTLEKQGRTDDALAVLKAAVDLAKPGGFIRPFVELGPTMGGLLERLFARNDARDYIQQLLAAFSPSPIAPSSNVEPKDTLITNRERDILELLAQRLHNKEIAENLFISTATVSAHLKHIYRKLDVHNRRAAVAKALDAGIL